MSQWLLEVGIFAAKAFIVAFAVASISAMTAMLFGRRRGSNTSSDEGTLHVRDLSGRYVRMADTIRRAQMPRKAFKSFVKARDAEDIDERPPVYVIDFNGDTSANEVAELRKSITAIVGVAKPGEEVIVRLTSPGGTVPGYGLGASQLSRIRAAGLRLTVVVDTVAASGGYMMAVVSDELVAAPFAIIGSIGVYMPVPNVSRLLKDHGVEVQELTSGKYKRTVSLVSELTEEGIEKTQQTLDETHDLFKAHVAEHRPALDVEAVSTGEHWYGKQALKLGLIDRIATSDDLLLERAATSDLFHVRVEYAERMSGRLFDMFGLTRLARTFRGQPRI